MKKYVAILLVATACGFCNAQGSEPQAPALYYCAQFYRWFDAQLQPGDPMKGRTLGAADRFELDGDLLSNGRRDSDVQQAVAEQLQAKLNAAVDTHRSTKDFFKIEDVECRRMYHSQIEEIKSRGKRFLETQRPLFSEVLPVGSIRAELISDRQKFLRQQSQARVEERDDVVIYTFVQQIGSMHQTATHVFTKATHPAHPAVFFVSVLGNREAAKEAQVSGSYAGARQEFDRYRAVLSLFNR